MTLFGEVILKPGVRAIDTSRIRAATDRRQVWISGKGGSGPSGSMTEEIDLLAEGGEPVIRRKLVIDSKPGAPQKTVVTVDAKTLRPISHETKTPSLKVSARYGRGKVSGVRKEGNHTQVLGGLEVPKDAFDLSSLELLLRAVDLSLGWRARLNALDPIVGRVVRVELAVKGEEEVEGRDCWVVESKVGKSRVLYGIDKNGRDIVRQAFSPSKGVTVEFR